MVRHHNRFFFGVNIDASLRAFHGDVDGILWQLTVEPDQIVPGISGQLT